MLTALTLMALASFGAGDPLPHDDVDAPLGIEARLEHEYEWPISMGYLLIAPSRRSVFVWDRWPRRGKAPRPERMHFYEFSEARDAWEGPIEWDGGGFSIDSFFNLRWETGADGRDVLCETTAPYRAVRVEDGAARVLDERPALSQNPPDEGLMRWRTDNLRMPIGTDLSSFPEPVRRLLRDAGLPPGSATGAGTDSADSATARGPFLENIALKTGKVIYSHGDCTELSVVDVQRRSTTALPPGKGRLSFDYWANARFSPCERYILMEYRYTPDSNHPVPPGVVQIFTADGQFVVEVVEFGLTKTGGFSAGSACWLPNDWIVYTTPYTAVFAKIVDRSGTAE